MNTKQPSTTKLTLKYFWEATKGLRGKLFVLTLTQTMAVLLGFLLTPYFLRDFFDLITEFSGTNRLELLPELTHIIIKILIANIIGFWICARLSDFLLCDFESHVLKNLENLCFQRIQKYSPDFFANNFVGSLVNKIGRFVWAFSDIFEKIHWNFLPNFWRFSISTIIIFYFAPMIAGVLLLWGIIFIGVSFFVVIKFEIPLDLKEASQSSVSTGEIADSVTNQILIKIFTSINREKARFKKVSEKLFRRRRKSWFLWAKMNIFQTISITTLEITVLFLMTNMWIVNEISIGTILMIQVYLGGIYMNLWEFSGNIKNFYKKLSDANEMTIILNQIPDIQDPKNPEKCKISQGKIEFKDVSFQYETKKTSPKIFENFDLTINAGEKVGLVGESGAGKSTFVNLLLRFSDLNKGKIKIDGQDITKITQNDLRSSISYVPQDSSLFHRSLRENIAYGKPNASFEEIKKSAKKAHAHEFILETSDKYDTLVGERGIKLSGGQKQRIAIARAMLKDAPILILDEATSALDSKSEKEIQKAFDEIFQSENRTTIVIAHRLSTLRKMDRIIVMNSGKIVEEGSHEDLLKTKGKYAELWNHQVGGFVG